MNRMTGTFMAIIACAVLAVVVFFLYDLSSEKTFASPAEVFEASRDALKKNDMRGFCQCLTKESRDLYAAILIIQQFALKQEAEKIGTDEQKALVHAGDQVFAKHGLTEEFLAKKQREALLISDRQAPLEEKREAAQAVLAPVRDLNGFIADMLQTASPGAKAENPFRVLKDANLSKVKITGTTAVGEISLAGQDHPSPMDFRKQGEGWRIDLFPEQKQRPMMPPGMPPGHP
jgi:hypothetical protein